MKRGRFIAWFNELNREDIPEVGGKCANLGELYSRVHMPVPEGFAITAEAYRYFLEKNNAFERINSILSDVDIDNPRSLSEGSEKVRKFIESLPIDERLEKEILKAYDELCKRVGKKGLAVAVRSSATAEDLPGASFAGQQDTFLNVNRKGLLKRVRQCWSSLFTPRAIVYRREKGFSHDQVLISVAVQQMVDARASGVMFTIEPVTGDREKIVINASWGLGEAVVSGQITPDEYVVEKKSLSIVKRSIARKKRRIVYDRRGGTRWEDVPSEMQEEPALSDKQIVELARYGLEIERHYNCSQDIEWALDSKGRLYILQARPETVFSKEGAEQREVSVKPEGEAQILIRGLGVSPGYGSGRVRVVLDVKDISEFKEGEVLVTEMTTPDWVPAMKKAAAIITDLGGKTCHAAIVSRELGVPCVVGTERATKVLGEGQVVTVDGQRGLVFEGRLEKEGPEEERAVPVTAPPVVTATKVYVNLSVPEIADRVASETGADGVGLLRAEHMMLSIGKHPRLLIQEGGQQLMIDAFSKGIAQVAEAFYPKPVVYRFLDFKPDEFLSLPGGERFEKDHVGPNPMIGFRGQFRYVKEDDLFRLELRAIKKVRDEMGFRNVWVMIPFVRTLEVFRKTVEIMHQEGLDNRREKDFQLWIMVEVPSACFMIDEFCREGIDGVSFGTNDLTMLLLGVDRNDASVQEIYDERNLAVLRAIAYTITVCRSYGVTTSICGQAPSVYPDYLEFMIRCGCTSVSVNPDAVRLTRQMVASVEEKIKLERALGLESAHRIAKIPMEEFFFWKKLPR